MPTLPTVDLRRHLLLWRPSTTLAGLARLSVHLLLMAQGGYIPFVLLSSAFAALQAHKWQSAVVGLLFLPALWLLELFLPPELTGNLKIIPARSYTWIMLFSSSLSPCQTSLPKILPSSNWFLTRGYMGFPCYLCCKVYSLLPRSQIFPIITIYTLLCLKETYVEVQCPWLMSIIILNPASGQVGCMSTGHEWVFLGFLLAYITISAHGQATRGPRCQTELTAESNGQAFLVLCDQAPCLPMRHSWMQLARLWAMHHEIKDQQSVLLLWTNPALSAGAQCFVHFHWIEKWLWLVLCKILN